MHIFAIGADYLAPLEDALAQIDPVLKGNSVIAVAVTDGADGPLY